MTLLHRFYCDKVVFLTGHTGFKGAWMAQWLASLGAKVHGYALTPNTTPNLFDEANVEGVLASHTVADIRDVEHLTSTVRKIRPDVVFHLAAQPLVRKSYREPRETYETNVMGTVNLLEAVRATDSVRVCQVVTSDKCYENREWIYPYRENEPMGGADPYSNSKGCAELVVAAYRHSFFHPTDIAKHNVSLSSARAGNVIGGGDWAEDRIIPDCIRALGQRQPIVVRNPHAIRPWQHVLEPLSGYLHLALRQWDEQARFADAYNFGPASAGHLTVREVVERAIAAWGSGSWQNTGPAHAGSAVHEATFLKLDVTKAAVLLGWHPVLAADDAIRRSVRWYAEHQIAHGSNAAIRCQDQINGYTADAAKIGLSWATVAY